jgi:hypothetical protein
MAYDDVFSVIMPSLINGWGFGGTPAILWTRLPRYRYGGLLSHQFFATACPRPLVRRAHPLPAIIALNFDRWHW